MFDMMSGGSGAYPYQSPYGYGYTSPYLMQQQQAQQRAAASMPSITVAQVPTLAQVEQVQMQPGERKVIFVQNDPAMMAIRIADQMGLVQTEYRRTEIIDPKAAQPAANERYAPADDVQRLRQDIDALRGDVEAMRKRMTDGGAKSDVSNTKPASRASARE